MEVVWKVPGGQWPRETITPPDPSSLGCDIHIIEPLEGSGKVAGPTPLPWVIEPLEGSPINFLKVTKKETELTRFFHVYQTDCNWGREIASAPTEPHGN